MDNCILEVSDVHTVFRGQKQTTYAVNGAHYEIHRGEIVGLVGESGCGKSILQQTVLRILPTRSNASYSGSAVYDGKDLLQQACDRSFIHSVRGGKIAMVFQNPVSSLNPVVCVGEQISETILAHMNFTPKQAKERAVEMMRRVHIPNPEERYYDYPHQFSGGMCQRIMIAIAISCDPELIIADEMTTALDVTTQAQILELMKGIVREMGSALLIISHNLGLVAHYADRIYIMYAGQMVEWGSTEQIFHSPSHAYTQALLMAVPSLRQSREQKLSTIPGAPPNIHEPISGCAFYPRCSFHSDKCLLESEMAVRQVAPGHFTCCIYEHYDSFALNPSTLQRNGYQPGQILLEIENLTKIYRDSSGLPFSRRKREVQALKRVNLKLHEGEILGLVGESGCGKSTLAKCILGLTKPNDGSIIYQGRDLAGLKSKQRRAIQDGIQLVFQDSFSSFDPRQTVGDIIGEPLLVRKLVSDDSEYEERLEELLSLVKLDTAMRDRRPSELSGGQQQRVGIARALACKPSVLICDEPLSALDVCVQAQIINLFLELKQKLGLAILFISHDLSAVRYMCDNIAVMYRGTIVEYGSWEDINSFPAHPYTKALIAAALLQDAGSIGQSSESPKIAVCSEDQERVNCSGCSYFHFCSEKCDQGKLRPPVLQERTPGHLVACHCVL